MEDDRLIGPVFQGTGNDQAADRGTVVIAIDLPDEVEQFAAVVRANDPLHARVVGPGDPEPIRTPVVLHLRVLPGLGVIEVVADQFVLIRNQVDRIAHGGSGQDR